MKRFLIKVIFFDLGDTLIVQRLDDKCPLDQMALELIPGSKFAVEKLASYYRLGIISNTSQSTAGHVSRALATLGIRKYFQAIVTSVDVHARKPSSEIFQAALQDLDVTPSQALMIGNSLEEDIVGAQSAGLKAALFDPANTMRAPTAPDFVFQSMFELPKIVASIEDSSFRTRT
jgi:putative hydrolase of the HAD superfamily